MVRILELAPSKIRFMHDRIKDRFSNGVTLYDTINSIESGSMNVYDLPKIRVVRRNGFYYAFDNRRLYVYRVLEHRGKLDKVKVKLAPLSKFKPSYFTTKNNGQSIRLTRGVTLTHSHATSPPSSPETMSADEDYDYGNGYDLELAFDILGIEDDDDLYDDVYGVESDDYDDYEGLYDYDSYDSDY